MKREWSDEDLIEAARVAEEEREARLERQIDQAEEERHSAGAPPHYVVQVVEDEQPPAPTVYAHVLSPGASQSRPQRMVRTDQQGQQGRIVGSVPAEQRGKASPVQPAPPKRRAVRVLPPEVAEEIARSRARSARELVVQFLASNRLELEFEHLLAIEECLTRNTRPAQFHAALSTRLLLKGVADHCFPPREDKLADRFGRAHELGSKNVCNRLAAFVDQRSRLGITDEEHRLFVATLDTVTRWGGRGPH
ncbi:MAG TPA: hypothetical protein VLL27_02075, partial [Solirubrobacterales bacterium]|nr:hypothetical protein [Solirubrobacterales bacterium]